MNEFTPEQFDAALATFIEGAQKLITDNYTTHYENLTIPTLEYTMGKRYVKVIRKDGQTSVHVFVDRTNGDVLKAAGWRAPAKGARGNIFDEHNGLRRMSAYGAAYNR